MSAEINYTVLCMLFIFIHSCYGWNWQCDNNKNCKRIFDNSATNSIKQIIYPTLELCQLACNQDGLIWPKPTIQNQINPNTIQFNSEVAFKILLPKTKTEAYNFLQDNIVYFNNNLNYDITSNCSKTTKILVNLAPITTKVDLNWQTDESYNLTISTKADNLVEVTITAPTIFGVRHGMETLLQLIISYPVSKTQSCLAIVEAASIQDAPVYKHRGLLLDSARNFLSIAAIKKNINAMAASKMNNLHWHATDSQSFPLELRRLPNMTRYGAYSPEKVYHKAEVDQLIKYAKLRGVRVVIELDGPSHSGSGWEWGPQMGLGNLAVCINAQPWRSYCIQPPCGQLNPANPQLYNVLEEAFRDFNEYLPGAEVFHMGGDEVFINCWNSTQEILDYIGNKPRTEETFLDLWAEHQKKVMEAYDRAVGNTATSLIVWTSHLTEAAVVEKYLPKERYVIQTWVPSTDELPSILLQKGYKLIMSTKDKWYLDHGFWGVTSYYTWRDVYNNEILRHQNVLGGEVCMWGEYVDDHNIEPRVWPRAAAAAERLWSNPGSSATAAQARFFLHRERLLERGVEAEALIPKWCVQNQGDCV